MLGTKNVCTLIKEDLSTKEGLNFCSEVFILFEVFICIISTDYETCF